MTKISNIIKTLAAALLAYAAAVFFTYCALFARLFDPAAPKQRIDFAGLLYGGDFGAHLAFLGFFALALLVFLRWLRGKPAFRFSSAVEALLFAGIFLVGTCRMISGASFVLPTKTPSAPVQLLVCAVFFYALIELLNVRLDALAPGAPAARERRRLPKRFFLIAAILLLAWLPYFLANFPGSVCNDARVQLGQALGLLAWDNNNPVFDTLVFGLLFRAGRALSGADGGGVAAIVAVQYLLMALSFSYVCILTRRLTGSARLEAAAVLFFALVPIFGGAGQVVLKDTLHLPFCVLMLCTAVDCRLEPVSRRRAILFAVFMLLSALTRKAAAAYSLAAGLGLLLLLRARRRELKTLLTPVLAAAALALALDLLIVPALHISPSPAEESLSLPFQQLAYTARAHEEEISAEDAAVIDGVLELRGIIEDYDPDLADPVKAYYHGGQTELRAFWKLYFRWLAKYPGDMLRAAAAGCWKYFYPFSPGYMSYRSYMADCGELGLELHYRFPGRHRAMMDYALSWGEAPLLVLLTGPGLYVCLLLLTAFRCLRRRRGDLLLLLLPLLVLLVGLLLTPVNGETRYAYPIIASAPLLISFLRLPEVLPGPAAEAPEESPERESADRLPVV